MAGVRAGFQRLKVIRLYVGLTQPSVFSWNHRPLKLWEPRRQFRGAHIYPDNAAAFCSWIGGGLHLMPEIAICGLIGHVRTVADRVEFPAVVHASQARLLVAAEEQAGAAVRAVCS